VTPLVVMGASGSGKSTLGAAVAARLGRPFVEGDELHPAENVAKMRRGEPLDDTDRAPWLAAVAAVLRSDPRVVVTCSALRRRYRDTLRDAAPDLVLVHVDVPAAELERRVGQRAGHFMPAALVSSQLEALEPPGPDENALVVDGCSAVSDLVDEVARHLSSGSR
jgi:gluconokinase